MKLEKEKKKKKILNLYHQQLYDFDWNLCIFKDLFAPNKKAHTHEQVVNLIYSFLSLIN